MTQRSRAPEGEWAQRLHSPCLELYRRHFGDMGDAEEDKLWRRLWRRINARLQREEDRPDEEFLELADQLLRDAAERGRYFWSELWPGLEPQTAAIVRRFHFLRASYTDDDLLAECRTAMVLAYIGTPHMRPGTADAFLRTVAWNRLLDLYRDLVERGRRFDDVTLPDVPDPDDAPSDEAETLHRCCENIAKSLAVWIADYEDEAHRQLLAPANTHAAMSKAALRLNHMAVLRLRLTPKPMTFDKIAEHLGRKRAVVWTWYVKGCEAMRERIRLDLPGCWHVIRDDLGIASDPDEEVSDHGTEG